MLTSRRFSQAERIWLLRSLLSPVASMRWSAFIGKIYERHARCAPNTAVLSRPLRNFGRRGLSPGHRVALMCRHHAMMDGIFRPELLSAIYTNTVSDLAVLKSKGVNFRIGLCNSARMTMPREGELVVFFQNIDTGAILAKKSVFLGVAENSPILVIGGLQGSPGAKTAIIAATRRLHGLRPKDAVLLALRAFAYDIGIGEVHAVANATHVITADNRQRKFSDYDDYWIERGATPAPPYGFRMSSRIETIEGDKGRDDVKRQVVAAVDAAVAGWIRHQA
ncbi:DUF535 family protein [Labrys miyagiensis]